MSTKGALPWRGSCPERLAVAGGARVGDKGYFPAAVEAMMVKAGVKWSSLHVVTEGYDPTVLPRKAGGLDAHGRSKTPRPKRCGCSVISSRRSRLCIRRPQP